MNHRTRTTIIATAALVTVVGGGVATAAAASGGDEAADQPITGPALDLAIDAALSHTGSGHVTDTELGDEDSYYEVEVTLDDGSQVDVQLDREFNVVASNIDVEDDQ